MKSTLKDLYEYYERLTLRQNNTPARIEEILRSCLTPWQFQRVEKIYQDGFDVQLVAARKRSG